MPLLISQIYFPSDVTAGRDKVTNLEITRGKISKGKPVPFLKMSKDDGAYWRYLVEVFVGDQASTLLMEGVAQLAIARTRIAGLMVMGELKKVSSKQTVKLNQDTGQMACFSVGCDELGLVGVPTNWRGKPSAIHLGTDIERDDGFAIKVRSAEGFLNSDGTTGPVTIERIVSKLEEIGLTVSRGASLY